MTPNRLGIAVAGMFLVLSLAACGGGGGGGSGSGSNNGSPPASGGSLDTSFGGNGGVAFNSTMLVGGSDAGNSVIVDGSGRLLVTGFTTDLSHHIAMALWRYNSDGTLDTTFGHDSYPVNGAKDGFVVVNGTAGGQTEDVGVSLALDSSGRILVAGYSRIPTEDYHDAIVWRFNSDGTSDTSFGGDYNNDGFPDGFVKFHQTAGGVGSDEPRALIVDGSGRILVSGWSMNTAGKLAAVVWRLTDGGALDSTFGGDYNSDTVRDGYLKLNNAAFAGSHDGASGIALDASGRILIAGSSGNNLDNNFMALWRLTADGDLDTTFGGDYDASGTPDGFMKHQSIGTGTYAGAVAVTVDSSNRVLVAGASYSGTTWSDMVLWRITENGALDISFGGDYDNSGSKDGYVVYDRSGYDDYARAVAIDSAGRILVSGTSRSNSSNDATIWRFTSSGQLDSAFGNSGVVTFDTPPAIGSDNDLGSGLALDSSNRILITGSSLDAAAVNSDMKLYRFNP